MIRQAPHITILTDFYEDYPIQIPSQQYNHHKSLTIALKPAEKAAIGILNIIDTLLLYRLARTFHSLKSAHLAQHKSKVVQRNEKRRSRRATEYLNLNITKKEQGRVYSNGKNRAQKESNSAKIITEKHRSYLRAERKRILEKISKTLQLKEVSKCKTLQMGEILQKIAAQPMCIDKQQNYNNEQKKVQGHSEQKQRGQQPHEIKTRIHRLDNLRRNIIREKDMQAVIVYEKRQIKQVPAEVIEKPENFMKELQFLRSQMQEIKKMNSQILTYSKQKSSKSFHHYCNSRTSSAKCYQSQKPQENTFINVGIDRKVQNKIPLDLQHSRESSQLLSQYKLDNHSKEHNHQLHHSHMPPFIYPKNKIKSQQNQSLKNNGQSNDFQDNQLGKVTKSTFLSNTNNQLNQDKEYAKQFPQILDDYHININGWHQVYGSPSSNLCFNQIRSKTKTVESADIANDPTERNNIQEPNTSQSKIFGLEIKEKKGNFPFFNNSQIKVPIFGKIVDEPKNTLNIDERKLSKNSTANQTNLTINNKKQRQFYSDKELLDLTQFSSCNTFSKNSSFVSRSRIVIGEGGKAYPEKPLHHQILNKAHTSIQQPQFSNSETEISNRSNFVKAQKHQDSYKRDQTNFRFGNFNSHN